MALPATGVIEVRTTGSDSNGGGFNSARGGTDYSQQDAAQASGTATVSGTTLTATTGIFTAAMVGNYVTDGTSWREITAFTSSTVVTIDSTIAWTGASIKVGGALGSPGMAGAIVVAGNTVFIQAGTYTLSSTTQNVSGGRLHCSQIGSGADNTTAFWGYSGTRQIGINSGTAILALPASGTYNNVVTVDGNYIAMSGVKVDASANSNTSAGWNIATSLNVFFDCIAYKTRGVGFTSGSTIALYGCSALACFSSGFEIGVDGCSLHGCVSDSNTGHGFLIDEGSTSVFERCRATRNTLSGYSGYRSVRYVNCIAALNGNYGWNITAVNASMWENCISWGNTSGHWNLAGVMGSSQFRNCAGPSGSYTGSQLPIANGFVTLTADPFTSSATGDFSLNNNAGGGAACRGAAYQVA